MVQVPRRHLEGFGVFDVKTDRQSASGGGSSPDDKGPHRASGGNLRAQLSAISWKIMGNVLAMLQLG